MSKLPASLTQIFPQPYSHAFCDAFNCRNMAKWFIGKPSDGNALSLCYKVCDDCLKTILQSVPDEFRTALDRPELEQQVGAIKELLVANMLDMPRFFEKMSELFGRPMPIELLQTAKTPIKEQFAELKQFILDNPEAGKKMFLETFMDVVSGWEEDEYEEISGELDPALGIPTKEYICPHCGYVSETPVAHATHVRVCLKNPKNHKEGDSEDEKGKQIEG